MNLDIDEKRKIVEDILESPEFKDSKRFQGLLRYLVEETLAGNTPKEITVGIQFFEKGNSFDPKEDKTVRVYINNLRKKLEHYYLTCNQKQKYRLVIPKGHYEVSFIENRDNENAWVPEIVETGKGNFRNPYIISAIVIAFIAGISISLLLPSSKNSGPNTKNIIWNDFCKADARPTLVLIGDFFFLYEHSDSGGGKFVRDIRINTPEDYKNIIKDDPVFAKKFVQSNFTYLRPSSCWGLSLIIPYLQKIKNGYSLKLASQFTMEDAKTNNIIYIGSFKNLYNLDKILKNFNIDYKLSPAGISVNVRDTIKYFSPQDFKGGNYEKDYAIVTKARGPEGSDIMLLMGFADSGVLEAARFISDPKVIEDNMLGKDTPSSNFTAVIETEGINQSINRAHIKYLSTEEHQKIVLQDMPEKKK